MIILYPRPWRPTRLQIAWRPRERVAWMTGYDVLAVAPRLRWWERIVCVRRHHISLNLGVGSLVAAWTWRAA